MWQQKIKGVWEKIPPVKNQTEAHYSGYGEGSLSYKNNNHQSLLQMYHKAKRSEKNPGTFLKTNIYTCPPLSFSKFSFLLQFNTYNQCVVDEWLELGYRL